MTKDNSSPKSIQAAHFTFIDNHVLKVLFYVVLTLAIALICFVLGMMIGYSVLGNGNALDVLDWKTWEHIMDFLK